MTDQVHFFFRLIRYFVIFFMAIGCSGAFAQSQPEFEFVGKIPIGFNEPIWIRSLAVDSQDQVYVLWDDRENDRSRVSRCQQDGGCDELIAFNEWTINMTVDQQDRVLLSTQQGSDLIISCQDSGGFTCHTLFGGSGTTPGRFDGIALTIDSQERIIIADALNDRIQLCSYSGICSVLNDPVSPLSQFCEHSGKTTQFCLPSIISVNSQDRIIVNNSDANRILLCNDQGQCTAFGAQGTGLGEFDGIQGIAVDNRDRIVVSDPNNGRVQICNDQGECTAIEARDELGIVLEVNRLTVDSRNRVIFADHDNRQLVIFKIIDEFQINAGLNDAWYNPDTDGQGFFINVFPDLGAVSLAWFTYDTELPPMDATAHLGDPGHRWLTAVGPIDGNQVTMDIELTSGGLFDAASEITRTDPPGSDGTLILTFDNCNSGSIEYDIPSINQQGVVPIQRVVDDNIVLCEALSTD